MKYLGIRTGEEVMNRSAKIKYPYLKKCEYYVFSNDDNNHTVGIPKKSVMTFEQIESHARELLNK